jgi:peptidoglycan-N-acetylglucosamine deacetylase
MSGRQAIKALMERVLPRRAFLVAGPSTSRTAYLTFDDGPDPSRTPLLLDVLRHLGVSASFFVIGEQAAHHPELVRRIVDEGHALGHHSYTHSDPSRTSARVLAAEARRTQALLVTLTGRTVTLFRPPRGRLSAAKILRLWAAGQRIVLWSADPRDGSVAGVGDLRRWFQDRPLRGGDIVLFHDDAPYTRDFLPELVSDARQAGIAFRSLSSFSG